MTVSIDYRARGQAVWLDSISSKMIHSGHLKGLIAKGAVYGVTSNPTIFGQAIQKNEGDYNEVLSRLAADGQDAFTIYDELTRRDIGEGADLFAELHLENPVDGWISLEVLPSLAHDAAGTVAEAKRLSGLLARPNVFIKVPSTPAGCVAIRELIGAGVSVNVTLMFNRKHYRDVANAYINGLADLKAKGGDLSRVHSVASFFVSRVDTAIDKELDRLAAAAGSDSERGRILTLRGKAGLANCKVVYRDFQTIFKEARFGELAAHGARVQRPLWASTGTKNPTYSDLMYVENLIGTDTVNTMPEKTLDALLDHGRCPGDTVLEDLEGAQRTIAELSGLGIDIEAVGERLQVDGVILFEKSYDELLATIEERRAASAGDALELVRTQKIVQVR